MGDHHTRSSISAFTDISVSDVLGALAGGDFTGGESVTHELEVVDDFAQEPEVIGGCVGSGGDLIGGFGFAGAGGEDNGGDVRKSHPV